MFITLTIIMIALICRLITEVRFYSKLVDPNNSFSNFKLKSKPKTDDNADVHGKYWLIDN